MIFVTRSVALWSQLPGPWLGDLFVQGRALQTRYFRSDDFV